MPIYVPGKLVLANDYIPVDPDFGSVSLLLHGDGTNGSTTIVDSSPSPKTVTVFGDAQISTAESMFGGASITFDGTGDYLLTDSDSDFNITTAPWTVEFFVYFLTLGSRAIVNLVETDGKNFGINIYTSSSRILVDNGAVAGTGPSGGSLLVGTWYHVAISRTSTATILFIDGQLINTYAGTTGSNYTITRVKIGKLGGSGLTDFHGYIDDLRITKGARYQSAFTPPTAPFPDIESR